MKIGSSVGEALYDKGVIGHVTIDLVSFPNVEDPSGHPFFWAVDISLEMTDNAAACCFFDILMEGNLNQQTGEYYVTWERNREDPNFVEESPPASEHSDQEKEEENLAKIQPVAPVKRGKAGNEPVMQ